MRVWVTIVLVIFATGLCAAGEVQQWPDSVWQPKYERALNHMTAHRLLVGYPDFSFRPLKVADRYEAAAVLSRMVWFLDLHLPEREWLPPDVPWNHWAADACFILTASRLYPSPKGVRFGGDRPLMRGEFALMAWNLVQVLQGQTPSKRLSDVGNPYANAAGKLSELGLLETYPDGGLHPEEPMRRWEICDVVYRLLMWNEEHGGPTLGGPVLYAPRPRNG